MIRSSTTTTATTRRIWISPPIVYDVTIPSSHRTTRTTTSVDSTVTPFQLQGQHKTARGTIPVHLWTGRCTGGVPCSSDEAREAPALHDAGHFGVQRPGVSALVGN